MLTTELFTRTLADPTRLRILMLLLKEEELCVCHLTDILQMVQPKVSRHLAVLRQNKILLDRRNGLWIHYSLHPELPIWCYKTLQSLSAGCANTEAYMDDQKRLANLNIPSRKNGSRQLKIA